MSPGHQMLSRIVEYANTSVTLVIMPPSSPKQLPTHHPPIRSPVAELTSRVWFRHAVVVSRTGRTIAPSLPPHVSRRPRHAQFHQPPPPPPGTAVKPVAAGSATPPPCHYAIAVLPSSRRWHAPSLLRPSLVTGLPSLIVMPIPLHTHFLSASHLH